MNHPLEAGLKRILQEVFEGPPKPVTVSYFTNTKPDSGIFGALSHLTAADASKQIYGTTLAAQTDHVRYHMWGTNEWLYEGTFPTMDWNKSWRIQRVSEDEWQSIQEGLRNEYQRLLDKIDHIQWTEDLANELVGSLAHSAYHLGAIQQMLKTMKDQVN
ncbi:hypothetical protein [Fictibacillus phosphorivorans]|uniref:hypothetical protein n=1 Tax=Fictibacillus phosphorivorans TaxID=1221500 RepID=UPI0012931AA7|nr:hypothetical protein [Fictibacillus phosphorivorans]MQR94401.1 hypothetical protein [Fictibacillus phosphorivorans]